MKIDAYVRRRPWGYLVSASIETELFVHKTMVILERIEYDEGKAEWFLSGPESEAYMVPPHFKHRLDDAWTSKNDRLAEKAVEDLLSLMAEGRRFSLLLGRSWPRW